MKKAGILVAVGVVALFFVACGGGGGQTPTAASATPTAAPVLVGELVQVTAKADFTLEPRIIELKVGKAYKVQFLNRGGQGFRLRIPRWDVMLFAVAGQDSEVSNPFVPDAAGDYDCYEQLTAASRGMKCIVRVSQ